MIDKDGKLLEDPRSHLCGKVAVKALSEEDPGYNWARWEVRSIADGHISLTILCFAVWHSGAGERG